MSSISAVPNQNIGARTGYAYLCFFFPESSALLSGLLVENS